MNTLERTLMILITMAGAVVLFCWVYDNYPGPMIAFSGLFIACMSASAVTMLFGGNYDK